MAPLHRFRRLTYPVGVLTTAAILAVVVMLPILGLRSVRSAQRETHDLGQALSLGEDTARDITGLVVATRLFDASNAQSGLDGVMEQRSHALDAIVVLERFATTDVPSLVAAVGEYTSAARAFIQESDLRTAHIRETGKGETAPNGVAYFDARALNLKQQEKLFIAATELRARLDSQSTGAIDRARWLSFVAAGVSVALFAAYAAIGERSRRHGLAASITETKLARAEEAAQQGAALVSMASHELRNPLSVLTLSVELLRMTASERDDEEMVETAEGALNAAYRAEALVGQLLDLSRLDADALNLELQPVSVMDVVERAREAVESYRVPHDVHVEGDMDAMALVDAGRLEIVLRNLIDNAFKYSAAGTEVVVRLRATPDSVVVEVADEGPGIPADRRKDVFNRFHRLEHTAHVGGLGIGLYLSRELVRRMGGELEIRDCAAGACFRVTVPSAAVQEGQPRGTFA